MNERTDRRAYARPTPDRRQNRTCPHLFKDCPDCGLRYCPHCRGEDCPECTFGALLNPPTPRPAA